MMIKKNLALCCTLAITLLATLTTGAVLLATDHSKLEARACTIACPKVARDPRCKVNSFNEAAARAAGNCGCPCQTCPDLNKYPSSTQNFCVAEPSHSELCLEEIYPVRPRINCFIACQTDPACQTLDFDRTNGPICACPCQKCPDNKFYTFTRNYTTANPVDEANCPHVQHPLPTAKDVCPK